ncbi:MAG: hypothetical protein KA110_13010 [Acidimicrobiia bacterium]|nr:hypothetical protein [Acidimicrobiia bacterium]
MTLEDTRASFDASGPILDFVMAHEDHPDYGDLRVLTDGKFRIQLRITDPDSELPAILEKAVGRSVEVVVGGLSRAELNTSESEIGLALNRAMTVGLLNGAKGYGVSSNFEKGLPQVEIASEQVPAAVAVLPGNVIVTPSQRPNEFETTLYSGQSRGSCSVGITLKNNTWPWIHAFMTAAHCSDGGGTADGASYLAADNEQCSPADRQTHVTLSNNVQDVFQHPTGLWVHVRNVAGGHYNGQWLIRVGQHTNEIGTIGTKTTFNHLGTSGECPKGANREGFWIDRVSGSVSQGGDSGGGGYLYYGTEWYAATLTAGHSGSETFVSWRSIPAGWSVCSQITPC